MPTNQNAYNSRVTDESLEKRFRDTFRSQGGAELVDDLYASGVIVPVVDFTQAATGEVLAQNLQTAWDFSVGNQNFSNTVTLGTNLITNTGFWQVDFTYTPNVSVAGTRTFVINDGSSTKAVWSNTVGTGASAGTVVLEESFVVFLRAGDSLQWTSSANSYFANIWYRQIATVNGDLVNPTGFTSS